MSCDVGLKWLISAVIRRLGAYANVRRKAKKYKPSPSPRPIYRGLGICPPLAPSLSPPPSLPTVLPAPRRNPLDLYGSFPISLQPLSYAVIVTLPCLYGYFAPPFQLLCFALAGRCSPFSGNLALTSPFILMSLSPEENIARLKAVLGQKLIPREISCGSEACVFYGKGDRAIRMRANLLRALGMLWRSSGGLLGDRLWLDDGWEAELQGNRGAITEE